MDIKAYLDEALARHNCQGFIADDPIALPHFFTKKQDIEIVGFWVAMLAWGNRRTILKKGQELIEKMDRAPHQFITQHQEPDRKRFLDFKHRTFNATDALCFLDFLQKHYTRFNSLEMAFWPGMSSEEETVENGLRFFHTYFFSSGDYPLRTQKHIASPARHSACKRLNMFLRWMVRKDSEGVDFGIWSDIRPAQLVCPCDVHVERVARRLGLIQRKTSGWQTALELTRNLRQFDAEDPIKYDLALFGLGLEDKF
ncbi:MAG: TIGR02757 family protein [Microscillaceae bacterium]